MKAHPPYHLRPNKAVDRLAFFEALTILQRKYKLDKYVYYGLGGPHLEEFRLLYEFCPTIRMVSLESDMETYKRQKFHLPCANLKLKRRTISNFLTEFQASGANENIFWLDYTDLRYEHLADVSALLTKLSEGSVLKISLRCEGRDFDTAEAESKFLQSFEALLPGQEKSVPRRSADLAHLLQSMFQIAAQRAFAGSELRFQPLSSFFYDDGSTGMFSIAGIVVRKGDNSRSIRSLFENWEFANLSWARPSEINLPVLSTKERLLLQQFIPCPRVGVLSKTLGYRVGNSKKSSNKLLKQYARYHRFFPYFMKATP